MDKNKRDDIAAIFAEDIATIEKYYTPPSNKSKKATKAYMSRRKLESYLTARELRNFTSDYSNDY